LNLTDNQRRAYEASLKEHRRAAALSYKLTGGRLNDQPRRKVDLAGALEKIRRDRLA
jgi:hypothetical protein